MLNALEKYIENSDNVHDKQTLKKIITKNPQLNKYIQYCVQLKWTERETKDFKNTSPMNASNLMLWIYYFNNTNPLFVANGVIQKLSNKFNPGNINFGNQGQINNGPLIINNNNNGGGGGGGGFQMPPPQMPQIMQHPMFQPQPQYQPQPQPQYQPQPQPQYQPQPQPQYQPQPQPQPQPQKQKYSQPQRKSKKQAQKEEEEEEEEEDMEDEEEEEEDMEDEEEEEEEKPKKKVQKKLLALPAKAKPLVLSKNTNNSSKDHKEKFSKLDKLVGEDEENEKKNKEKENPELKMSVEELMEYEFKKIVGQSQLKKQIIQFYKKVELDKIRKTNNKNPDKKEMYDNTKRLYHMIFSGPPGTGKTTMAKVVSKIMLKMKILSKDRIVFVNNALELTAGFVGQTAPKVDAKVAEAKGGIIFIDEAYSLVAGNDGGEQNPFGKEAIDTIMKHLDPPTAVFIFAGYERPMNDFLKANEGLSRRIPYRFKFEPYNHKQLADILKIMCEEKGETLDTGLLEQFPKMLEELPETLIASQNAAIVTNWLSFAQIERDSRIDIDAVTEKPEIATLLTHEDFEATKSKLIKMFD